MGFLLHSQLTTAHNFEFFSNMILKVYRFLYNIACIISAYGEISFLSPYYYDSKQEYLEMDHIML